MTDSLEAGTNRKALFDVTPAEAAQILQSDVAAGLGDEQVRKKQEQYGYNEIIEAKANGWRQFLKKFWGLSAWLLELVVLLSWYLQKYSDVVIVMFLLVVNALLSYFEERQAERSLDELKTKLHVNARVLRAGVWSMVSARELVPGDVIRIRTGDFVPADLKLFNGGTTVDQSSLTGESENISKLTGNNVFSGSVVVQGEATGMVLAIGKETYFGRTTQLIQLAHPKLHLEEIISVVVKKLAMMVSGLVVILLGYLFYRQLPVLEALPLVLVVLLSAIPVALPVMMTVTTALGARELARKGVLVTRLNASEDAAMMDMIFVDKTGTLTLNKMGVTQIVSFASADEQSVIKYGFLACQESDQDAIDIAFIDAAHTRNIELSGVSVNKFVPFSPMTRRTEVFFNEQGVTRQAVKGAVGTIIELCDLSEPERDHVLNEVAALTSAGNKVLAVALSSDGGQYRLLGLVGLYDTPRPDSKELIQEAGRLGIQVKMLTGDALPTARRVAEQVDIVGELYSINQIKELLQTNPLEAAAMIEKLGGLAEVYPEDKFLIVKSMQQAGHIVGMTGDGVNDAPALKQAEVGIAVSNATDVAKEAAGMVLTTPGLSGIIDLVKIGRSVHRRIEIWVLNKISRTLLKSTFVLGTFLLTGQFWVSAFAMLLLIFMTDFVKIALATDNVQGSEKPSKLDIGPIVTVGSVLGAVMVVEAGALLYIGINWFGLSQMEGVTNSYSFAVLFFLAVFSLLSAREESHFWHSKPSKVLSFALMADALVAVGVCIVGIPGLVRLTWTTVMVIVSYTCLFSLVINDFIKVLLFRYVKRLVCH